MSINPSAPFYGTNAPDKFAAVRDVDINQANVNQPEMVSAKAVAVVIAGTVNAIGTVVPLTGGGGGGGSSLADNLVIDSNGVYWIMQDQGGGIFLYYNVSTGVAGTPTAPVTPASKNSGLQLVAQSYTATAGGTGYSVGDVIEHIITLNMVAVPPTVSASVWVNINTGAVIAAPLSGNINAIDDNVNATIVGTLPAFAATPTVNLGTLNGAATEATLAAMSAKLPATLGQKTSANSMSQVLASDQPAIPVKSNPPQLFAKPAANTIAALNGSVAFTVVGGCSYYLSVTNPAAVTTQFVGTLTFQSSIDGGASWQNINAMPATTATAQTVQTSTTTGLWVVGAPNSVSVQLRATMTAYTSGTVAVDMVAYGQVGATMLLPWFYTVTAGQTLVGPLDTTGIQEIGIQISAVTTTVLTVQGTNDPSLTTWDTIGVNVAGGTTAPALTISAVGSYRASTAGYKYVRVQVTTTGTVLSVQGVMARLGAPTNSQVVVGAGTLTTVGTVTAVTTVTTVSTVTAVTTVGSVTAANLNIPGTIADVASAALTTTTTTAAITPTFGCSYEVNIPVTVVSGTTPTLDVVIQESDDGGTNWFDVYHFPRITAVGFLRSPKLPLTGNRVRYVQTVSGTTPSFTRAINRLQSSDSAQPLRKIFDRTLTAAQALNAVTAFMVVLSACRNMQLVISAGTITTTAPALQLQGSDDNGVSWYNIGAPLVAVTASTVQLTVNNVYAEQVRAIVTTAGVAAALNYVGLKAF